MCQDRTSQVLGHPEYPWAHSLRGNTSLVSVLVFVVSKWGRTEEPLSLRPFQTGTSELGEPNSGRITAGANHRISTLRRR